MKAPTSLLNRPGRAAAAVGAVVAVSATAAMAIAAGTASADEPGRCTDNVNVRAEPNSEARIVALCEAGTEVKVAERQGNFVKLTDLAGWAAAQYVSVNGAAPAAGEGSTDADESSTEDDGGSAESSDTDTTPDAEDEGDGQDENPQPGVGGLFG